MVTIESLVAELNDLSKRYISEGENFKDLDKMQDQHFILAGKLSDLVLFNDPDNFLIVLFKK